MPTKLELALLGEPDVLYGGAPLSGFVSAKVQALLFYLAVTGRAHSRDTLATLFWHEMPEAAAKKNLTKALSNLRKLVGDYIETDNQSAGLNPALAIHVDVHLFEQALDDAESPPDLQVLQQAVELYQGDFLRGFLVKEAPVFEEWARTLREQLHQMAIRGLQMVADRLTATQDESQAIHYLTRLLTIEPLYEPAHIRLMLCLARTGQRSAALAQYETCCRLLADELGVEPSAELRDCYRRIKSAGAPRPHNLPAISLFIGREAELAEICQLLTQPSCRHLTVVGPGGIGKTWLALQAAASFTNPAATLAPDPLFADGVFFIPLTPHREIESMLAAIAEAVGVTFQGGTSLQRQLFNYLRQKHLLFVLDNFEHLLATAPLATGAPHAAGHLNAVNLLVALLDAAPNIKLLVTSHVRLGMQAEHVLHLTGLEVPGWSMAEPTVGLLHTPAELGAPANPPATLTDVAEAREYGSVQLFIQSARRLLPPFELTTENARAVAQICQRVQGMPLGIVLAATWITVLTPVEILAELESSLDLLETEEQDVPMRQRSVRAAFDYTWNLLPPHEQRIFIKLSLFRGDFSRQALQKITGASLHDLLRMVDKSLILPAGAGRFMLHELLRQFGEEKLAESAAVACAAREQHARYYAQQAAQYARAFMGPQQRTALLDMEMDSENIRVAWHWSVTEGDVAQLAQIVDGLCQFYVWRGRFGEGGALVGAAYTKLTAASGATTPATTTATKAHAEADAVLTTAALLLQVELLIWRGIFARYLGQREHAIQYLEQSLHLLAQQEIWPQKTEPQERPQQQAFALLHLGETLREQNRQQARHCYEQSLLLYRQAGNHWGAANTLTALGWLVQHWGDYHEARQLYAEGLAMRQELGDQRGVAISLRSVGGVALYQGDLDQAERLIRESMAITRHNGDRVGTAASLGKLGEVLIGLGQFQDALAPLQEANAIYDNLGLSEPRAFIQAILALAALHLGHYSRAQEQAAQVLAHFRQTRSQRGVAYALLVLGWATLASDSAPAEIASAAQIQFAPAPLAPIQLAQTRLAQTRLEESLAIYGELGQQDELGQAHALLGLAAFRLGATEAAQAHLLHAQQIAEKISALMPRVLAQTILCHMLHHQAQHAEATRVYKQIVSAPLVMASQWAISLTQNLVPRAGAGHEQSGHSGQGDQRHVVQQPSVQQPSVQQPSSQQKENAENVSPLSLKERLAQARRLQFVGRVAEGELLRSALQAVELPFNILHVFGAGGVGKTTLLHEFARIAQHAGWTTAQLDARNIEPSPHAFEQALRATLGVAPTEALHRFLQRMAAVSGHGFLLFIDTSELLTPLDGWLRDEFLPQLPATVLTIFASRKQPSIEWRTDPGWQPFVRFLQLQNLEPKESQVYLAKRQIPASHHQSILDFTHGHPLALSLFAELYAQQSEAPLRLESTPNLISALVERFVENVPTPAHRIGLEACAMVRLMDEVLLTEIIDEDAANVFAWLRTLSFMDAEQGGLFPHDLARETICADLRWRNRERYADLHQRARAYYIRKFMQDATAQSQQRVLHEYIFLHRESPVLHAFFEWQENGSVFAEEMKPADHEEVLDQVELHEGGDSARLAAHWLAHDAHQSLVFRDATGGIQGFLMLLALEGLSPAERKLDPAAQAAWSLLEKEAPLQAGERATLFRFWLASAEYQAVSPVQSRIFIAMVQHYLATPGLVYTFLPCADPEFWHDIFAHADMHRLEAADFTIGNRRYGVFGHNWRIVPPFPWLSLFAEREIAMGMPHTQLSFGTEMVTLREAEFMTAVHDALRTLHDLNALRASPLLQSRCIVQQVGVDADEQTRMKALRTLLRQSADALQKTPRQLKFYRALHHTYFQPAATQEQAAELLDLPFSTYRRHLRSGVEFVAEALWARELNTTSITPNKY